MRYASRLGKTAVVVKLLRDGSNELHILRYLHSFKSLSNHTVPLLDSFEFELGCLIILPEGNRLDIGLDYCDFGDSVTDLMHQFVEGVAFLHQRGVAHLDIKPQNVVVGGARQLWLIDFDISVRVESDNSTIDWWCGTPGWMAPEIGKRNGPRRQYSPIRADLWSCGLVLRCLLTGNRARGHDKFAKLSLQLLNKDPGCRPALTPWLGRSMEISGKYRGTKRKVIFEGTEVPSQVSW
jgi:serine/threonine protein kinase